MGMFDYFEVDDKIDCEGSRKGQTKDLSCSLDTYRVDANGILWRKGFGETDFVEHPYHGEVSVYIDGKYLDFKFKRGILEGYPGLPDYKAMWNELYRRVMKSDSDGVWWFESLMDTIEEEYTPKRGR